MSKPQIRERVAGVAAASAATGAALCAVCCVLPLALPAVALASFGGVLAWLARGYTWVTGVALFASLGAWIWIWRQSVRARARPARSTLYLMTIATAFLALALLWPLVESHLVRALRGWT